MSVLLMKKHDASCVETQAIVWWVNQSHGIVARIISEEELV